MSSQKKFCYHRTPDPHAQKESRVSITKLPTILQYSRSRRTRICPALSPEKICGYENKEQDKPRAKVYRRRKTKSLPLRGTFETQTKARETRANEKCASFKSCEVLCVNYRNEIGCLTPRATNPNKGWGRGGRTEGGVMQIDSNGTRTVLIYIHKDIINSNWIKFKLHFVPRKKATLLFPHIRPRGQVRALTNFNNG